MDQEELSLFEHKKPESGNPMDIEFVRTTSINEMSAPKLKTTISLASKSLIQKLFFGSMITQIQTDKEIIEGNEELFGPILLDPTTNYFYKSWENHFYNTLENFRETGVPAIKWDLVKRFPEILCFQIQRAGYNKEKKCPEKNNQRFEFDQEIYVDRFLINNKETVQDLRQKADSLEKERNLINSQVRGMSSFRDNRDIIKSVEDVLELLRVLNGSSTQDFTLPESVVKAQISNIGDISSSLDGLRLKMTEEKEHLKQRNDSIDKEIRGLYSSIENTKYVLFSIIIHEGTADSGHFYCFVRMADKWFKFNDFYVREIDELEVMETSFGYDGSIANAYCVFYMNEELFRKQDSHKFALLGDDQSGYFKYVPQSKLFAVTSSNMAYQSEINKAQVKKINSEYVQRFDQAVKKFEDRYENLNNKVMAMRSLTDFCFSMSDLM